MFPVYNKAYIFSLNYNYFYMMVSPMMMRNAWMGRWTNPNGRLMALGSTESHAVWLKLMIPHLGLTQTVELRVSKNT